MMDDPENRISFFGYWRYKKPDNQPRRIHVAFRIGPNCIVTFDSELTCGWCGPVMDFLAQHQIIREKSK